eukprot:5638528-Prorocentrum_lima.AAC.1
MAQSIYGCRRPADRWYSRPQNVLWLVEKDQGWAAVHASRDLEPIDLLTSQDVTPIFYTTENPLEEGWH